MLELINELVKIKQEETCPCDGCYVAPCGCCNEFKGIIKDVKK